MNIILKDGSSRELEAGASIYDLAKSISGRLAKEALAGEVNGEIVDLSTELVEGDKVSIITYRDEEGVEIFKHSAAHLMAHAVTRLYPDAKLAIGPAIERGYYYDFDLEHKFKQEDLLAIEKEMKKIASEKLVIERMVVTREEALDMIDDSDVYKKELITELPDGEIITFYKQGDFMDLCRGPHVPHTGVLKANKLLSIAGAYWRGDENNKMLQRLYGISFPKAKLLEEHLAWLEEIKKRDHNKIGRELGLFTTSELIGQGLPLLMPKGAKIVQTLQRFVEDEEERRGYELTKTPLMAKSDLYKVSGHWQLYKDGMFVIEEGGEEDNALGLRPMTCPFQFQVYKAEQKSYRDLPVRYAETSTLFRNESSGEMHGLIRVRQFTISEGHLMVTPEQLEDEFKGVVSLANYMMDTIGIRGDVTYQFSKWDPNKKDKYVGSEEVWEATQSQMKTILDQLGLEYEEVEGEAAFYGPKLDLQFKNVHGKEDTIITVQIDFSLAERFDMTYVDKDGQKKNPIVIHRTSIGCYERTLAMLIEKYAGAFPTWLAPVQVKVLPISEKYHDYAWEVVNNLKAKGIRVEIDERAEKIGYKIREAQLSKVPHMLVIGQKEAEEGSVAVRTRFVGDKGSMSQNAFIEMVSKEIEDKVLNYEKKEDEA